MKKRTKTAVLLGCLLLGLALVFCFWLLNEPAFAKPEDSIPFLKAKRLIPPLKGYQEIKFNDDYQTAKKKLEELTGVSQDQFLETRLSEKEKRISAEWQVFGLKCLISIDFFKGGVYRIYILFLEKHDQDHLYLRDWSVVEKALIKEYGEPSLDLSTNAWLSTAFKASQASFWRDQPSINKANTMVHLLERKGTRVKHSLSFTRSLQTLDLDLGLD